MSYEGSPISHDGRASANATWTLGPHTATPVYVIPWGSRYRSVTTAVVPKTLSDAERRVAIDWRFQDKRHAMLGITGQPKGNLGWDVQDVATSWIIEASK